MLKFILLVIALYLLFRLVLNLFGRGFFIRYRTDIHRPGGSVPHRESQKKVIEADYEVIGTQLKDNDPASHE